jgi:hypothetical protein
LGSGFVLGRTSKRDFHSIGKMKGGRKMSWNYLEARQVQPRNKHGLKEWQEELQNCRERGLRLVDHELVNCYLDSEGIESHFDQMIVRDYDTREVVAVYEQDEIDQANRDYEKHGLHHATFYME